ncbi:LysR family transcriptional regulator [Ferrimonas senticii]|uniref:LysR family transcriptional regulator n=1 Tax=Ferrimonas senticii TaxID=394566 RepID=UPI00042543B2|nr:LysR family transcriptional regulator [Ferrimonas senticii]
MNYDVSMLEIKLLLMTVQFGNFSEVARRQDLTPSAVSRKMAQLEHKLGVKLLHRHTRSVSLTAEGQQFVSQCRPMLAQFEQLAASFEQRAEQPSGSVKLSVPVAFGRLHVAPYLQQLLERYPQLNIELQLTDEYVDPAAEGIDLLLRIGVINDSSLRMKVFAKQRYLLAASPEYLGRYGQPQSPTELTDHNCLVFKGIKGLQRWYFGAEHTSLKAFEVGGSLYSNNAELLVQAAIDGAGIVLFPSWLIGDAIQSGKLLPLLSDWHKSVSLEPQQICALYLDSDQPAPKVRAVIDFLAENYGSPVYWDA